MSTRPTFRNAVLLLSGCALLAMVVSQFAALVGSRTMDAGLAHAAELVSSTGGLTVLTTDAGNDDVLVVLDTRNEELLVYRTDLTAGMQLVQRYSVSQLFVDARARSLGR